MASTQEDAAPVVTLVKTGLPAGTATCLTLVLLEVREAHREPGSDLHKFVFPLEESHAFESNVLTNANSQK